MKNKADAKAGFLLLEAAEQGRPVEFVAQFIASYILSGELGTDDAMAFLSGVLDRVNELMNDQGAIWDGLMPGPPFRPLWRFRVAEDKERRILTEAQFDALAKAERHIYHGEGGTNGWTDVLTRDDSQWPAEIWDNVADQLDVHPEYDSMSDETKKHQVARRVAQILAIVAFGAEILIK